MYTKLQIINSLVNSEIAARRSETFAPISEENNKKFHAIIDSLKTGDLFWFNNAGVGRIGKFISRDVKDKWKIYYGLSNTSVRNCYFYEVIRKVTDEEINRIVENIKENINLELAFFSK